jgi:hypothetical protein
MKQHHLILSTLLTPVLASLALTHAGWFTRHLPPKTRAPQRADARLRVVPRDPLSPEEVQHYRSGQPTHWRHCLLHH